MKNRCRRCGWIAERILFALAVFVLPVAFPVGSAHASAELDRQFSLETVGFLRAWDNMDGLFGDYVATAYKEYFSRQSRFVLQDLSKADALLGKAKTPYQKLIDDSDILSQIARSMRSESIIRTKVYKEGSNYRFVVDWLHAPKIELIATETMVVEEKRDGGATGIGDVRATLHTILDALVRKVPWAAHVTGRDNSVITVNVGVNANLQKGDTLVISTVDEVKRHPLLKAIVDWRLTSVGKADVFDIDDGIAFARVIEEEPGRQISRFQKVVQIIPRPAPVAVEKDKTDSDSGFVPSLGWGGVTAWVGSYNRQDSSLNDTAGKIGSGLLMGARADSQLWITKDWFGELGFGYGYAGYSQLDIQSGAATAAAGVTASVTTFRFDIGYIYRATADVLGPRGWVKAGYKSTSYSLPISNTEATGPSSFGGMFIGIGGDMPMRGGFGALLNFDFGLITSATETGFLTGTVASALAANFFAGGYYRLQPRADIRLGIDVLANSANMSNGASLSHRVVSFGPSLLFYF